jgi:hypothetical protein
VAGTCQLAANGPGRRRALAHSAGLAIDSTLGDPTLCTPHEGGKFQTSACQAHMVLILTHELVLFEVSVPVHLGRGCMRNGDHQVPKSAIEVLLQN